MFIKVRIVISLSVISWTISRLNVKVIKLDLLTLILVFQFRHKVLVLKNLDWML